MATRICLILGALCAYATAFQTSRRSIQLTVMRLTPEEQRAAAFSDYLAQAHREKLQAIQVVEEQKKEEIKLLKEQISALSGTGEISAKKALPPATQNVSDLMALSKEDLAKRVVQYQDYMARYIIDAQEQKAKAIQEAKDATMKQFEEKLKLLQASSQAPPMAAGSSPESELYAARNKAVSAAAAAGKSRWGEMEVAKVATSPASSVPVDVPPEVEAADHGLRADGGVGGPSLAERVTLSFNTRDVITTASTTPSALPPAEELYHKRNTMVKAAAVAGKSRWGQAEIDKIRSLPTLSTSMPSSLNTSPVPPMAVPPEVEAADHGLRADGGVGGPSLADRVALSFNTNDVITKGTTSPTVIPSITASPAEELYHKRNAMVKAAAAAGKSRWGQAEVAKISGLPALQATSNTSPSSSGIDLSTAKASPLYAARNAAVIAAAESGKSRWHAKEVERINVGASLVKVNGSSAPFTMKNGATKTVTTVVVPPEVEAADHGLRADGGVGGPTLADRVTKSFNLGAVAAASVTASSAPAQELYHKRNAMVQAAAAAGKSRWGAQEIEKIQKLPSLGLTGGAVNGAVNGAANGALASASDTSLYEKRNAKILAAAQAGKSRWGDQEIAHVKNLPTLSPSNGAAAPRNGFKVVPLQERVNFGASLVAK